jgi:hypothetical protein
MKNLQYPLVSYCPLPAAIPAVTDLVELTVIVPETFE